MILYGLFIERVAVNLQYPKLGEWYCLELPLCEY